MCMVWNFFETSNYVFSQGFHISNVSTEKVVWIIQTEKPISEHCIDFFSDLLSHIHITNTESLLSSPISTSARCSHMQDRHIHQTALKWRARTNTTLETLQAVPRQAAGIRSLHPASVSFIYDPVKHSTETHQPHLQSGKKIHPKSIKPRTSSKDKKNREH